MATSVRAVRWERGAGCGAEGRFLACLFPIFFLVRLLRVEAVLAGGLAGFGVSRVSGKVRAARAAGCSRRLGWRSPGMRCLVPRKKGGAQLGRALGAV